MLAADLELLADLNQQISQAEEEPTALVPASPPRTLTSVPGWGVVRTAAYGAAVFRPPQDNHRTPVRADQARSVTVGRESTAIRRSARNPRTPSTAMIVPRMTAVTMSTSWTTRKLVGLD
ncbi:MAG TPA: hypothetical protein VII33_19575, partial [Nakamurella sp.]